MITVDYDYIWRNDMIQIESYNHIRKVHIIKENEMVYQMTRESDQQTRLFPVGCIFKSFLSAMIGIAIEEGKIQSIDDLVIDYLPYDVVSQTEWYALEIKHVLSKTTGSKWPGSGETLPDNINDIMKLDFENRPGLKFKYKPDPIVRR